MKIDYTNLSFTQLIDKIEKTRFFDLPRMVREAFTRLLTRVEILENTPAPTGDFIPLSGTTEGNPVTGDIEFDENERVITKTVDGIKYSISPFNGGFGNFTLGANISAISDLFTASINSSSLGNSILYQDFSSGSLSEIYQSNDGGIIINSTSLNAYGIKGNIDFTPNITDLDYVQKKYVDERGSVVNETTSVLSASDLNTAYPNAKDGFSVIAPNVVGGGKYYIKAGAGWVYQQILAVV